MIRVAHSLTMLNRGGAETFVMNLYKTCNNSDYIIDFVLQSKLIGDYANELSPKTTIHKLIPRKSSFLGHLISWLKFAIKNRGKYDVIHFHKSNWSSLFPVLVTKIFTRSKIVVHSHNTMEINKIHKFLHYLNKPIGKRLSDISIACSNDAGTWMFGRYKKYKVIKNGIISQDYMYNRNIRKKLRKELNLNEKITILNVARFTEVKNQQFLIKLMLELKKLRMKTKLLLVGDGDLLQHNKDLVKKLDISNYVEFLGIRRDVNELMSAADIFILPSLYEGLPLTMIEAQCSGINCIVSSNIDSSVKLNSKVHILPLNKPSLWISHISNFKNFDRESGLKVIQDNGYSIEKVSEELLEIYKNKGEK